MEKTQTAILLVGLVLAAGLGKVGCCSPVEGFKFLSLEDIMARATLVLLGTDIQHIEVDDPEWRSIGNRTDSIFQVSCVLKNTNNVTVNTNITIRRIFPRTTCETSPTEVGKKYIITVKPLQAYEDTFEWHEVKDLHRAARSADDTTVGKVMQVCGFQTPRQPTGGATGSCPTPVPPEQCTYYSGKGFVLFPSLVLITFMLLFH